MKSFLSPMVFCGIFCCTFFASAQETDKPAFWQRVRIGGGVGAGFGSGYTNVALSPGAVYDFNTYVSAGIGITGSYIRYKRYSSDIDEYRSWVYGGSLIGLVNPVPFIQISIEPELLRVNTTLYPVAGTKFNDDFWSAGLFIGAGYRTENVTLGLRYNVLYDADRTVYGDALMPFIRIYF